MKNIKKTIVILLVLLLCGCASKSMSDSGKQTFTTLYNGGESAMKDDYYYAAPMDAEPSVSSDTSTAQDPGALVTMPSKIIVTTSLEMESSDLDKTLSQITDAISRVNGYVQKSSVYNDDSYSCHSAYIVVRVPADRYDEFMKAAEGYGNVLSVSTSTDDITTSYYDLQSRLESLKQQRERVLEFYKQAKTIEELILVEQRLSEIDSEIAAKEIVMQNYNLLTSYSTVIFDISEVNKFTDTRDTFLTRLGNAFSDSLDGFLFFLESALFALINSFWYILLIIAVILIVSALNRKYHFLKKPVFRSRKEKAEKKETDTLE
ncbi:MAG: DUF4349 domain-containing protein [Erysipelotrichaceae bacterium]|nr:DUF4349 domain-containing protein [Erysipelotrichaceae bacterium]